MALVPSRGSNPCPLPDQQTVVNVAGDLDQISFVRDTFINRTAFNPITYAGEFSALQGYLDGARVLVTYFNLAMPSSGRLTDAVDSSVVRNTIHTSYTCINNLEITLIGGLSTTYNDDNTESTVSGEAYLYPGLSPRIGDLFVLQLSDGKYGKFQISKVDRLSYRQGSNHRIQFYLNNYATTEEIQLLLDSSTETLYFDKTTYMGDTSTILKANSYLQLQTMRNMRTVLITDYFKTFYNKIMNSIVNINGIYDPYLVRYLLTRVSIVESKHRPNQLYASLENYDSTIWSRLNDKFTANLNGINSKYDVVKFTPTRLNAALTSLTNKNLICVKSLTEHNLDDTPCTTIPECTPNPNLLPLGIVDPLYSTRDLTLLNTYDGYVLSTNFYNGNILLMNEFEQMVYTAITTRQILDISYFIINYLNTYTTMTTSDKFYTIPLLIYLIDIGINNITNPSGNTNV